MEPMCTNLINTEVRHFTGLSLKIKNDMLMFLIEKGADINAGFSPGFTYLHRAAGHRNIQMIKLLLKLGLDINAKSENGDTPLHYATYHNMIHNVVLLLNKGADINIGHNSDNTISNSV